MRGLSSLVFSTVAASLLAVVLSVALPIEGTAGAEDRQDCEAQLGHAHGHLDFLKQVGDPAPGNDSKGFGFVTFSTGEEARFAGVLLLIHERGAPGVAVVDGGEACLVLDGRLQLVIVFRDVRTGDIIEVTAITREPVDGPGSYEATATLPGASPGSVIINVHFNVVDSERVLP